MHGLVSFFCYVIYSHTNMHARTHARTHACTLAHTHTHTHGFFLSRFVPPFLFFFAQFKFRVNRPTPCITMIHFDCGCLYQKQKLLSEAVPATYVCKQKVHVCWSKRLTKNCYINQVISQCCSHAVCIGGF